jgi:deazaflavin-dependent oxidoreductase (nitroreductase family)
MLEGYERDLPEGGTTCGGSVQVGGAAASVPDVDMKPTRGCGLVAVPSHEVCHLTTTGRRTGRPHRIEIWFLEADDTLYLFSGGGEASDWVRNLRHEPQVWIELPGRPGRAYSASIVDAPADLRRRMDVRYYGTGAEEELTDWARRSTVVSLTPSA